MRVRPALQAGAVVVCEGFVDATIVAYRTAGVEEQRLARVAQWAVNGLKADLTVLVDGPADGRRRRPRRRPAADGRRRPSRAADRPPAIGGRHRSGDAAGAAAPRRAPCADASRVREVDADPVEPTRSAQCRRPDRRTTADEDDPVDPVQAYRDRASYTPERYLIVRPLTEENGVINPEVVERISSVLRLRSPSLAEPQPAG